MMIPSKPAFAVLVTAIIFLTVVGPLPLCLLVLLPIGLLRALLAPLLVLLSSGLLLTLFLLALGLSLLILVCCLRPLLLLAAAPAAVPWPPAVGYFVAA